MKKILFFAASLVLSFSLACCDSNNKSQSSSSDNESSIDNDSISVADNTEEEAQEQDTYAGLSFKDFAKKSSSDNVQSKLQNSQIAKNLKGLGFTLADKKTEKRLDYTGTEYYNATVETYTKTINGQTTTVLLDDYFSKITFPNENDAQRFFDTAKAAGLKKHGNKLEDNPDVYWDGTDVEINGNVVTLNYRWEA